MQDSLDPRRGLSEAQGMNVMRFASATPIVAVALLSACATAPSYTADELDRQEEKVDQALTSFRSEVGDLDERLSSAHAYIVFPDVGRGAAGVGAGVGDGLVYRDGKLIGTARLIESSVGAQLGGEVVQQVVLVEGQHKLDDLLNGEVAFDARATASSMARSASTRTTGEDGISVLLRNDRGLMASAAIGIQNIAYEPM